MKKKLIILIIYISFFNSIALGNDTFEELITEINVVGPYVSAITLNAYKNKIIAIKYSLNHSSNPHYTEGGILNVQKCIPKSINTELTQALLKKAAETFNVDNRYDRKRAVLEGERFFILYKNFVIDDKVIRHDTKQLTSLENINKIIDEITMDCDEIYPLLTFTDRLDMWRLFINNHIDKRELIPIKATLVASLIELGEWDAKYLIDNDKNVRITFVLGIGKFNPIQSKKWLQAALHDKDVDVVFFAILAVSDLPSNTKDDELYSSIYRTMLLHWNNKNGELSQGFGYEYPIRDIAAKVLSEWYDNKKK